MRKGQIEIIGLVVIILLLFFGLILYFRFSTTDTSNFIQDAENNLEVSNMLSAIRLYSICEGEQLEDAIESCVNDGFICGEAACDVTRNEIDTILRTYGWDDESYMFFIEEELVVGKECFGNTFVDEFFVSSTSIRLVSCR